MSSDAIVVGEEWISEHYFTTDATKESFKARVLARRSDCDATKEDGNPRTRFTAARTRLLNRLATLDATTSEHVLDVRAINADVRSILGYDGIGFARAVQGPVTFVHAPGLEHTPGLAIIDALPAETIEDLLVKDTSNLSEPFLPSGGDLDHADVAPDQKDAVTSVARLLSLLFVHDDYKPAFALVLAGPHLLVAERERWPEGRYLAVDLQLVAERNDDKKGGEVDRALTCVSADSLAPDAQGDIWWSATLAESVKHTVGVSKDLREGVRLSIEIIANEVVARRKAQGLDPLPAEEAQPLAKQSLRFLYRILFLLYAEASPELGVLPTGAPEYENGYSLDRLRELVLVELPTQRSQAGTHLYESLGALFRLVDQGHDPARQGDGEGEYVDGLTFRSLRADLFKPEATAHIDEVGLGNAALQRVLRHLLLSKEQKGRDRGFISYAELGINQLGAVYEGLMSYTGFFAETDLYEVAKDGNAEKGSWVVPVERAQHLADKDFVTVEDEHGERKPVLHQQGTFVFRLAGRERQQSASYYTPEVLTRFVVSQALEELLDQDGKRTTAAEILELTICEPALGSGAFAIEAVRQLAEQYLARRQEELGQTVDPDAYPRELQRVKAYLALHQVYGVDLNATAVELAEISLWLDTMIEGLEAPWFGLHLRRGNSLIGARKAVYSRAQVEDKSWLKAVPKPVRPGAGDDHVDKIEGRVPHFLLPAEGWAAAADVGKDIKELVPDQVGALKTWRKSMLVKPNKKQVDALVGLGRRVERLWDIAGQRLAIAEQQIRRDIPLWNGSDASAVQEGAPQTSRNQDDRVVTREEIEASLADPDGAYRRLGLVMDAWCALWSWPLTEEEVKPPTLEEWYDALSMILGGDTMKASVAKRGDQTLESAVTWDDLGEAEHNDRIYAGAARIDDVVSTHPWIVVCEQIAGQHGFFHWELEFASVFAERDGFDLQVGNPPWVRPVWDEESLLAEGDPWWQLKTRTTQDEVKSRRRATLELPGVEKLLIDAAVGVVGTSSLVSSPQLYPNLRGLQPDLYRCFMDLAWSHLSPRGVAGLIHPETHFTDAKASHLRMTTYRHLRRHWHFVNERLLFEIDDKASFGVHIYGQTADQPGYLMATYIYLPEVVERSMHHDGSGEEPGLKDPTGAWDLRPHLHRIQRVDLATMSSWHELLEDSATPVAATRMVYAVNRATSAVVGKLASAKRIGELQPEFSTGWHEKGDRARGYFDVEWGPVESWTAAVLQGPNFHLSNPFFKSPNKTMLHNQDWTPIDLESLSGDALPVTSYKPRGDLVRYDKSFTHWGEDRDVPARAQFRVAWRGMAANKNERTLVPCLIPPGAAHIHGVESAGLLDDPSGRSLVLMVAGLSSLVADFLVRVVPKSGISGSVVRRLPFVEGGLGDELLLRALRLNCLTSSYAPLWSSAYSTMKTTPAWTGGLDYPGRPGLADVGESWSAGIPLRRASDRRQALVEIDAVVALSLGLTAVELASLYRSQFAVLYGYDHHVYFYDANGRLVPNSVLTVWRRKGDDITKDERTAINPSGNTYEYVMPFRTFDREADMRQAYAHFEKVLAERTSS